MLVVGLCRWYNVLGILLFGIPLLACSSLSTGFPSILPWSERGFYQTEPHMPTKISRLRSRAFTLQSGRCFYCAVAMWEGDPDKFALRHGISVTQAMRFQCTAEHLIPLQNGGGNSPENIVAACRFCNQNRHRRNLPPSPGRYKRLVSKRLSARRWHPSWTFRNEMLPT